MTSCPPISGREADVAALMQKPRQAWSNSSIKWDQLRSGFACTLAHAPTDGAAGQDQSLISHLQYMLDHPNEGITTMLSHSPIATDVLPNCSLN